METSTNKNLATLLHLSTLSQFLIPFGNFIFPLVIWSSHKTKSEFIDYNGKQAINFQVSIFLYSLVMFIISIALLIYTIFNSVHFRNNMDDAELLIKNLLSESNSVPVFIIILTIILFIALKLAEFFLIIYASVKTSNGEKFSYPLTLSFLK